MTQDLIKNRTAVYASPRQQQGDFGRGTDHAPLGSSDDVNRVLNERGAYRDAESDQDPATSPQPLSPGKRPQAEAPPEEAPRVKPRPQRAEPMQPDLPGRGSDRIEEDPDPTKSAAESAAKSQAQSRTALSNVRDGYDR